MSRADELRRLSDDELRERLDEAYQRLWSLRFQRATGQLQDTSQMRKARREIARIKTILRERELWAEYERAQQAEQANEQEV
ncbi:MAG: 50S ribosomal protein L29 [Ardenticatenia bacterium]|nr:50S ribosomal protein L29 [Ardenticatenia bacterium]